MSEPALMHDRRPPVGIEPLALRRASSAFPTGVTIVSTVTADGTPCGLTVNSFTTVSLDPPLVSWSLKTTSPSLGHFDAAEAGSISILAQDQAELAMKFATPLPDKFDGVSHSACPRGVPIIDGCLAHFECSPWSRVEAGDHILYIWRVDRVHLNELASPLTFHAGGFRQLLT